MTILGGNLGGMDEAAEPKASLTLEGNQLALLGIEAPQVGQCIEVCAEICIESISAFKDEKGVPHPRISFSVERIMREEPDPMDAVKAMFPSMQ